MELRWYTEHWQGLDKTGRHYIANSTDRVLQYRVFVDQNDGCAYWSEWKEVEDVHEGLLQVEL